MAISAYGCYKISVAGVFAKIGRTLRSVRLVVRNCFGPLDEVGMEEAAEVRSVLLQNPILFLLYDSDPPEINQPLLLDFSLLLLFLLPILIQLDLPESLNFSLVLLLLHSFLIAG